jgi:hypothetical protein
LVGNAWRAPRHDGRPELRAGSSRLERPG